jgi:hypothetical protein
MQTSIPRAKITSTTHPSDRLQQEAHPIARSPDRQQQRLQNPSESARAAASPSSPDGPRSSASETHTPPPPDRRRRPRPSGQQRGGVEGEGRRPSGGRGVFFSGGCPCLSAERTTTPPPAYAKPGGPRARSGHLRAASRRDRRAHVATHGWSVLNRLR